MGEVFRVRVSLVGSRPEVWRLIEVAPGLSLDQVHTALQVVMGWDDAHLHDFEDHDPDIRWRPGLPEPRRWGPSFLRENDEDLLPEEDATLGEVLAVDRPLFYEYDLGDRWLHRLDLIEIRSTPLIDQKVTVVRGKRRCPLEDSGGTGGYEQLLDVLADPGHEEHWEYADWVSGMTGRPADLFDPDLFDPSAVNRVLQRRFRTAAP